MRILHIGLLAHYTEGMTYQDNMLVEQNIKDGHVVGYISDNYKFINGVLTEVNPGKFKLDNGLELYRVKLTKIISKTITRKIVYCKQLYNLIEQFSPDVIFHHGAFGYSILTVREYIKKNNGVKFFVDSHSDRHNGANNWFQKLIYRYILNYPLKKSMNLISRVYYISYEAKDFLTDIMNIKSDKLEYFPLGGIVPTDDQKKFYREQVIEELSLDSNTIISLHTGKLNTKKRTVEMLRAFTEIKDNRLRLIIIGSIDASINEDVQTLIKNDNRIMFLGWKNNEELYKYLCAADIYLQLGTQSATLQNAACAGAMLLTYPYPSYVKLFGNSVYYIENESDLKEFYLKLSGNPKIFATLANESFKIAKEKLNYEMLANKYLK